MNYQLLFNVFSVIFGFLGVLRPWLEKLYRDARLDLKKHSLWGVFKITQANIDLWNGKNDFKTYSIRHYHTIVTESLIYMCQEICKADTIALDRKAYEKKVLDIIGKYSQIVTHKHNAMGLPIAQKYRQVTLVTRDRMRADILFVLSKKKLSNKLKANEILWMVQFYVQGTIDNMNRHNEVNGDLKGLVYLDYVNQ